MTDPLRNWLNDATPVITYDQAFFFRGRATGKVPFLACQRRKEEGANKMKAVNCTL